MKSKSSAPRAGGDRDEDIAGRRNHSYSSAIGFAPRPAANSIAFSCSNATSMEGALGYASCGLTLIPCRWAGKSRKAPLTSNGLHGASSDSAVIYRWWTRWSSALIGLVTGDANGFVVLDIDVKDGRTSGYDTLEELGFAILPETPMVHTPSGGLHLYFSVPLGIDIRNTGGARGRGIGPGLDWRGRGGYVIAPTPSSGYEWDPHWNLDSVPLALAPFSLLPRSEPAQQAAKRPVRPIAGLSPYAEAALDNACRRILAAPAGEQEATLNGEAFAIGTLAGAGGIPVAFARRVLVWAAARIRDHDPCCPWRAAEIERKISRAFTDGLRHPRSGRYAA